MNQENTSTSLLSHQRSGVGGKRNQSRLGTGQTFATGRCVTSPLSIGGKKKKILQTLVLIHVYFYRRSRKASGY